MLYPKNDAVFTLANPCQQLVFNWSKVRLIDHYAIIVDHLEGGIWSENYFAWAYTNSNVTTYGRFDEDIQYRWKVVAVAPGYDLTYSRTVNNFTVTTTVDTC